MKLRRVVVTGLGCVAPGGNTPAALFASVLAGRSGITALPDELAQRLATPFAGQVSLDLEAHPALRGRAAVDRFSGLALVAAADALAQSGLDGGNPARTGLYIGSGMGGALTIEDGYRDLYVDGRDRLKPFTVLAAMTGAAAAQIGLAHGLRGPALTYSCACASSSVALGEAFRAIRHGYVDAAVAGGAEALLSLGTLKAWDSLRALALGSLDPGHACRPFAADRTGLVLGEGAAVLILEAREIALARGARVLAEIVGYASNADGEHLTRPSPAGQAEAMRLALADAGVAPGDVDYLNAHGTGTRAGDAAEARAIEIVFGPRGGRLAVSSTKAVHGHLMGAAGALEMAINILALQQQVIPPTTNLQNADPALDLDFVPLTPRPASLDLVMSNSFAFGGTNAVLLARRAQD